MLASGLRPESAIFCFGVMNQDRTHCSCAASAAAADAPACTGASTEPAPAARPQFFRKTNPRRSTT